MPPKAKPKPKAAVRAKAKAHGGARPGILRRPLHRPAAEVRDTTAPGPREKWLTGQEVALWQLPIEEVCKGLRIVVTQATYYMASCKVAGTVQGLTIEDGAIHLQLEATGATSEALLKHHSGSPSTPVRCHRCPDGCSGERVADDLVHAMKARLMKPPDEEEPWARNLLVVDTGEGDELKDLRARDDLRLLEGESKGEIKVKAGGEKVVEAKKKDKKKDKKKGRSKKKKKKKKGSSTSSRTPRKEKKVKEDKATKREASASSSASSIGDDGKRPRAAALKPLASLFRGTGLDPRERVRKRVTRRARRAAKRSKSERSSSSSQTDTEASGTEEVEEGDVDLFEVDSKVKKMADAFPGALCCHSLNMMRQNLLQSIGEQTKASGVQAVCVSYYRQQLHRRATPPVQRELMTISAALDWLVRGSPARTADILSQRLKSIETVLGGTHWSVAQRMELSPQEGLYIAAPQEVSAAQKDAYSESKVRQLASQPDGRKGKGKSQEKPKEHYDQKREKGKGQGSNYKGEKTKPAEQSK